MWWTLADKQFPFPPSSDYNQLSTTANTTIPDRVVQPGLEMVVEIDPDNVLGGRLGTSNRIPASGRTAVEVEAVEELDLELNSIAVDVVSRSPGRESS